MSEKHATRTKHDIKERVAKDRAEKRKLEEDYHTNEMKWN